jgi:hypothetical protein
VKVFVFDLLAYDANLDHLKNGEPELPYPLAGRHFDAMRSISTPGSSSTGSAMTGSALTSIIAARTG